MASKFGIRLTKRLGQHLLVEPTYLHKVVDNGGLETVDQVLEVGPGTGNLTELLIEKSKNVLAVELDERFCVLLKSKFGEALQLFHGDILERGKFNPAVGEMLKGNWALVANLPYNVASPVMIESLNLDSPPRVICVTIQKEVARRLAAKPGGREYGALSVLVQALSDVKIITYIPPGAFLPPPKVQSAIVKIVYRPDLAEKIHSRKDFRNLVNRLFRHRRKTLRGGWIRMLDKTLQADAEKALMELNIDPGRRAETLSICEFVELSNRMK